MRVVLCEFSGLLLRCKNAYASTEIVWSMLRLQLPCHEAPFALADAQPSANCRHKREPPILFQGRSKRLALRLISKRHRSPGLIPAVYGPVTTSVPRVPSPGRQVALDGRWPKIKDLAEPETVCDFNAQECASRRARPLSTVPKDTSGQLQRLRC